MSVSCTYSAIVTVQEVLEANPHSAVAANRRVTHNQFNSSKQLSASSTPPVTKVAAFKQALTAGAATVDLALLTGANGASVDGTGLKVQVLKVKNLGDNTLTLTPGVANAYNLLGSGMSIALEKDQEITIFGGDLTPDVASGAKEIDLAGTGAEESEWIIVMG